MYHGHNYTTLLRSCMYAVFACIEEIRDYVITAYCHRGPFVVLSYDKRTLGILPAYDNEAPSIHPSIHHPCHNLGLA